LLGQRRSQAWVVGPQPARAAVVRRGPYASPRVSPARAPASEPGPAANGGRAAHELWFRWAEMSSSRMPRLLEPARSSMLARLGIDPGRTRLPELEVHRVRIDARAREQLPRPMALRTDEAQGVV